MFTEEQHQVAEKTEEALGYETDLSKTKLEINWIQVIVFTVMHIGGLYGLYLRSGIFIYTAILLKASVYFSIFGIIIGNHRLFSHRSYKATKTLQILIAIATSSTYHYSIYHWAKDHRVHHKYSETNADPHNSSRGFFFSHIGWLLAHKQKDVIKKGKEMDFSDLENNPIVMFQHKYCGYCSLICSALLPTFIPWYFWGESLVSSFYVCSMYKSIVTLNSICCINSFAHLFGTKIYNINIAPSHHRFTNLVSLGEGDHNYHHTFPSDYRSSEASAGFGNLSAKLIDFLSWIGLAYDRKATPTSVIETWKEKYGDQSDLSEKYLDNFLSKGAQHYVTQFYYLLINLLFIYAV